MNVITENIVLIWLVPVVVQILLPLTLLLVHLFGTLMLDITGREAKNTNKLSVGDEQNPEIRSKAV